MTTAFFAGAFETNGGGSKASGEPGASGTAYLEHVSTSYKILRIDNKKQRPIRDVIKNEGRKVSTSGGRDYLRKRYEIPNGIVVLSSEDYYVRPWPNYHAFKIRDMFDGNPNTWFIVGALSTKLSINLRRVMFVNHVRIFPICNLRPSNFKVRKQLIK